MSEQGNQTDWALVADWAVALGTFLLAFVAVFQDKIRDYFKSPRLDLSIELSPPDCHKTTMVDTNSTRDGESFTNWSAYYYLIRIWNKGKTSARNVEVIVSDVSKKEGDKYKRIEGFIPDNLLWSTMTKSVASGKEHRVYCPLISPDTFKHCNIGHINDPKFRAYVGEDDPTMDISETETVFCFDVNFKSNKLYFLIPPGTYNFKITAGCENASTISKYYTMTVSGKFHEEEPKMLNEGLSIKEI